MRQRRTKSANRNPGRADFVAGNESANEHIGTGSDKGASANVSQSRIGSLIKVVDFCQTNTGASVFASHDRRIISCGQGRDQRGFLVVGRRDTGIGNFRLLRLFPIVVSQNKGAVSAAQLDHGISERRCHSEAGERRADPADTDAF